MEILVGSHVCTLSEKPDEAIEEQLREATKFQEADANFKRGPKFLTVDGKKVFNKNSYAQDPNRYLYHKGRRTFPTGLLPRIKAILQSAAIVDDRPEIRIHPHNLQGLRPHQKNIIDVLTQHDRAAGELPTGTGKSYVAAALALATYESGVVLITVPAKKLLRQTLNTLKRVFPPEIKVGQWGENKCELEGKHIVVATIQSITAGLDDPKKLKFLESVLTWILDEAHGAAAKSYIDVSRVLPNARKRWGITATWRREDGCTLVLEGVVGPLVFQYTPQQAMDDGWLVKPDIELHHWHGHKRIIPKPQYSDAFKAEVIYNNTYRNQYVKHLIEERFVKGGHTPCLVLVESLQHGDALSELTGYPFIDGQRTTSKEIDRVTAKFAEGEVPVLIASRIFNVGVDIPEVRGLLLPAGGKSVTTVMQRLGRALRIDEDKTSVLCIDIFDQEPWYLEKHAHGRRFTYAANYPGCVKDIQVPAIWYGPKQP